MMGFRPFEALKCSYAKTTLNIDSTVCVSNKLKIKMGRPQKKKEQNKINF